MSAASRQAVPRLRRRAERQNRPPVSVLLLHGMATGVSSWDELASLLAPHLELWDVTLPWSVTGDPAWAREPDVTQWVSAPLGHLRRVAGRGPDVVVAHSFAANVVLELLTGSDLLASTPVVLLSPFYRSADADLDWATFVPDLKRCYSRVAEESRRRRSRVSDEAREAVVHRILERMGTHAPLRLYETYQRTPLLRLESLTMPLFLVGGSDDDMGASADGVRALAGRIPHARVEILDGCGHFPMTERAPQLAALLEEFIDQAMQTSPTP